MWEDTMRTIAMVTFVRCPGHRLRDTDRHWMARSNRVQSVVNPMLDLMQTMPSFVYLIPVIMLFGIGKVPGLIAVIIYAIPPIIRLTNLGIRLVDKDVLEAADAFGSSSWQKLKNVQMPLALPTIMAGINQTIMMALAMVVVASMVGVQGLGQPVLNAINNQYFTLGVLNGLAIVGVAIIFRPRQPGLWQAPSAPLRRWSMAEQHTGIGISIKNLYKIFGSKPEAYMVMPSRTA
jgi:glycine betaine/proline transport system permease protein